MLLGSRLENRGIVLSSPRKSTCCWDRPGNIGRLLGPREIKQLLLGAPGIQCVAGPPPPRGNQHMLLGHPGHQHSYAAGPSLREDSTYLLLGPPGKSNNIAGPPREIQRVLLGPPGKSTHVAAPPQEINISFQTPREINTCCWDLPTGTQVPRRHRNRRNPRPPWDGGPGVQFLGFIVLRSGLQSCRISRVWEFRLGGPEALRLWGLEALKPSGSRAPRPSESKVLIPGAPGHEIAGPRGSRATRPWGSLALEP